MYIHCLTKRKINTKYVYALVETLTNEDNSKLHREKKYDEINSYLNNLIRFQANFEWFKWQRITTRVDS